MPGPATSARHRAVTVAAIVANIVIMVVCLNWAMLTSAHRMDAARRLVDHTRDVRIAIRSCAFSLVDAEASQRSYVLSRDSRYLDSYEGARRAFYRDLDRLSVMIADNPAQRSNVAELRRAMDLKFEFMDGINEGVRDGKPDGHAYDLARGHALLVRARSIVDRMDRAEVRLLDLRDDVTDRASVRLRVGLAANLGNNVVLFGFLLYGAWREWLDRRPGAGRPTTQPYPSW